eukprot:gb/GEZN01023664.1/.p1 GENE.gb/GEZN01023664.1/~~gb/GEZN01023664.1/.p1  ORF type:complete len:108 (+),score=11.73 gb/GEZN01023664.1/:94-417(+)
MLLSRVNRVCQGAASSFPRAMSRSVGPRAVKPVDNNNKEASKNSYGLLTIVGSSSVSSDEAVKNAISKAGSMVENLRWFTVEETRGHIYNGQIGHWQVTIKVGHNLL